MTTCRPRILAVDDNAENLQILGAALASGFDLQLASSGEMALTLVEQAPPDLILLDVMMPGMDGFEVCRCLKNHPTSQHIPVIFMTAMAFPEEQELGFALGAADYITKPFNLALVLARIKVHVQLKLKSELFEELAFIDGLTDIPNRRALDDTLVEEMGRSKRNRTPLSVLIIDIDHFKAFNDAYGHGAGDACLQKVATALKRGVSRPGDFVGRYGGEEFCAVLPNCDAAGAALVAEKLRDSVEKLRIARPASEVCAYVTVSVGYTSQMIDEAVDPVDPAALTGKADQALYWAKAHGRNQISGSQGS